jgi:formate/nitrite transporter FocA (FNT family)
VFTWKTFIVNNLIPVTLGNIVGGSIMVGSLYWYSYMKKDAPVQKEKTTAA